MKFSSLLHLFDKVVLPLKFFKVLLKKLSKKMNKKTPLLFSLFFCLKSDSLLFIRFPFISNAVMLLEEKIRVRILPLDVDIGWFCK